MAQSFLPSQQDTRTFGVMQTRLIDDLNRPDLSNIVIDYLLDAMRFWSRKAFFFTEIDNTVVPPWVASTMYPLGSTIQQLVNGITYAFVAMSLGTQQSGMVPPVWTDEQYVQGPGSAYYEAPPIGTPGTVLDASVMWANIGPFQPGYHTQLSTVPRFNQYLPPIDYVAPYQLQMTTANQRLTLEKITFEQLSEWDVIRPSPIAAYPRFWAYWQQQIYTWVYPSGFFPITLNYYCAPLLPLNASDTNYWTTAAERLIRKTAQASISREILYDSEAAQLATMASAEELAQLKGQAVSQQGYRIPAGDW